MIKKMTFIIFIFSLSSLKGMENEKKESEKSSNCSVIPALVGYAISQHHSKRSSFAQNTVKKEDKPFSISFLDQGKRQVIVSDAEAALYFTQTDW